jgi:NitT/TauT family transport system substrate-binding protein
MKPMKCCEKTQADGTLDAALQPVLDRRTAMKGLAGAAVGLAAAASGAAYGQDKKLRLAFCGQLLCVVPYEVTRDRGHFREEGLDLELVYTRGGNQAMQALIGGAVDYAGTAFDVALEAFANGANIRRIASTGRLPLFALATGPKTKDSIKSIKDLEGKTIGISGLGNADHILALYVMQQAHADPKKARFATLGTNLFDVLRLGQVDAAMVQEPALTLIVQSGGGVLFNAMDINDANRTLGGPYEFMGVAVRADERERRKDEMQRLVRALAKGLHDTRTIPVMEIVAALPKELVAGGDRPQLIAILDKYRQSLYPDTVKIDTAAAERVAEAHRIAGVEKKPADLNTLLDLSVANG